MGDSEICRSDSTLTDLCSSSSSSFPPLISNNRWWILWPFTPPIEIPLDKSISPLCVTQNFLFLRETAFIHAATVYFPPTSRILHFSFLHSSVASAKAKVLFAYDGGLRLGWLFISFCSFCSCTYMGKRLGEAITCIFERKVNLSKNTVHFL